MEKTTELIGEIAIQASYRFDESLRMIRKSFQELSEEELWQSPNDSLNSVANLILHLCGNIRQYVIASLGEKPDERDRDAEFAATSGYDKKALLKMFENTIGEAKAVIQKTSVDQLLKKREVQGFYFSGIGIVVHAVEHCSYHTGQIAFWTKLLKNRDLGFYEGLDLNIKNDEKQ